MWLSSEGGGELYQEKLGMGLQENCISLGLEGWFESVMLGFAGEETGELLLSGCCANGLDQQTFDTFSRVYYKYA